jgi:hypothetical protein
MGVIDFACTARALAHPAADAPGALQPPLAGMQRGRRLGALVAVEALSNSAATSIASGASAGPCTPLSLGRRAGTTWYPQPCLQHQSCTSLTPAVQPEACARSPSAPA